MQLKELRRRVAKSQCFSQTAVQEVKMKYENGVDDILRKLDNCRPEKEEEQIQNTFKDV